MTTTAMVKTKAINKTITFLGAGNMAEALISGLITSGLVQKDRILAADVKPERLVFLKNKYGIHVTSDAAAAAAAGDVVFLAVKPQHMQELLESAGGRFRRSQLVISIAAGITTSFIEKFVSKGVAVVRAMPNTPALVGAGAVAVAKGKQASAAQLGLAVKLFSTSGLTATVPERHLDAVTALSGSGPAYVFYLAEALTAAGVKAGLPKDIAEKLSRQTIHGAGKMLNTVALPASELRRNVTSPGGTTAAALEVLEKLKFIDIVGEAVQRAKKRARELAK